MGDNREVLALLLLRLWCEVRVKWFAAADECNDNRGEFIGEDALWFIRDDNGDTELLKWLPPCVDGDNPSVACPPFSSLILSMVVSSNLSASKAEFGVDVRPPWEDVEPAPLSKIKLSGRNVCFAARKT